MEPRIAPLKNYNSHNNTRRCKRCENWLDLSKFSTRVRNNTLYYREVCKKCSLKTVNIEKYNSPENRRKLHRADPRKVMLTHARKRAKIKSLDFNIDSSDIIIPELCPLLNIPIFVSDKKVGPNSPTIDRIVCEKGYIKGNVIVISHKANCAKNDLTIEELELLLSNLKRVLYKEEELLES